MRADLPLAGKTIVVTRPQAQAAELGRGIAALGGEPFYFPLLEILPVADAGPLQAAAARLDAYALVVFVSPNAVRHALPSLLQGRDWPAAVRPVAVGPGTAAALAAAGVRDCLCPVARFDSEALLQLPELAATAVAGRQVLILRGNGGRELLGDTLEARGARVERVSCYQRRAPATGWAAFRAALAAGRCAALTLSSSEALGYLLAGVPAAERARLFALPLFAPHARIAEHARAAGFVQVVLTDPADAGLLAGLCAYNWSRS